MTRFFLILALGLFVALVEREESTSIEVTHCFDAVVTRVHDGDTPYCDVHLGLGVWLRDEPVRLLDCWAPELRDAGGLVSRSALEELLDHDATLTGFQPGKRVLLHCEGREKYGRLLGTIYADGRSVNAEQVRTRHAKREP